MRAVRPYVEHEPAHRLPLPVDGRQRATVEVLRVGEEQRRVVPVDHESRHRCRLWIVVDVVHPGQSRYEAQHAVVRPGDAAQHVRDGQADRQQHAVQDVED